MSSSPPPTAPTPPTSWRALAAWAALALVLIAGLVLAVRFGRDVPVLLDGALR